MRTKKVKSLVLIPSTKTACHVDWPENGAPMHDIDVEIVVLPAHPPRPEKAVITIM
jgi:hypothetical protein